MVNLRFLFALCVSILFIAECGTTYRASLEGDSATSSTGLVWPPPPQTAKIRYLKSVSGSGDVSPKKSWLRKTVDAVFGRSERERDLLRPYGVFADAERIYVTDPGTRMLHVFDIVGKRYTTIVRVDEDEFQSPIGVAVDRNGDIYLSDSLLKRVFVLDGNGKYRRDIGSPERFQRPAGLAIYGERVYVVDTHAHAVLVFSKHDGAFLFNFGRNGAGDGEFNYPTNIFIDRAGLLYVTDSMNFRVQIFDGDGRFVSAFGKLGDGSGDFSKPRGIAVDSDGNIYVVDALFDAVQIFDREGRLLLAFGSSGRKEGQMTLPAGLFIDGKDRIYVVDSYNKRVQIFQYMKEGDSRGQRDGNQRSKTTITHKDRE